jgi:hypothetical protein
LELYVAPEAAEHLEQTAEEEWIPLEQLQGVLSLAAAPYPEPGPLFDRLGVEMVEAWFTQGAPEAATSVALLLEQLGAAYGRLVRGDLVDTGELSLVRYDATAGEAIVRSTTPLGRELERGILRGLLCRCQGVLGAEVESTRDREEHLLRVWVRATVSAPEAESFGERVYIETSAAELDELRDVGVGRFVQGEELFEVVERARETDRELSRCQVLLRTVNGGLSQALTNLGGQHRVLDRLVREQRTKTHAVTKAEKSLEEATRALHELRAGGLHMLDELCERLPGSRLAGRYDVLRRLGHGASSVVFQARDHRSESRVALRALRVIGSQWAPRIAAQAARIAEAGILHVPEVHDVFTWAGAMPCVVTEEVEGRSLRRILAEHGPLDEGRAATIARDVLEVLAAAHEAGLPHGDVRPENVLVSGAGPVLLELELSPVSAQLPKPASSRAYRPFKTRGELEATPAGDVFGVGAVLIELLTGEPPVEGVARRLPTSRIGMLCASALEPSAAKRPSARELSDAMASLAPRVSLTGLVPELAPVPHVHEESGVFVRPSGSGKVPRSRGK